MLVCRRRQHTGIDNRSTRPVHRQSLAWKRMPADGRCLSSSSSSSSLGGGKEGEGGPTTTNQETKTLDEESGRDADDRLRRKNETRQQEPLEEVVGHALLEFLLVALFGGGLVHDELWPGVDGVHDLHDGGHVAAAVAVVRRGEDGDAGVGVCPGVALHDELVRPDDEFEVVGREELLGDVGAEGVASTAGRDAPAAAFVGVGPHEVAHGAFVRDLLEPVERLDVVDGVQRRRQARVRAEDLVFDGRRQRQRVEERREVLPDVGVAVLPEALVVEAVDLCDLPGLVVAADQRDARRISRLQEDDESGALERVVPAVDVVAEKQVVRVGRLAGNVEQFQHVVELPVDVPDDDHRSAHELHVLFFSQDPAHHLAQQLDLALGQRLLTIDALQLLVEVTHLLRLHRRCAVDVDAG
eukprot:CAMPEP_0198644092 /NCGR_PEP_ID=MMETSP1467-20131203/388_1 /TAXON_ID=1462469 /ORGANISM="unid. sp., Strain CCMP2135" /LENGTH=411 /DNA_ID=CAMNT_0044379537 /DNA_START=54 /DNA_END=1287 /DNA_ORIENTATION=-